MADAAPKNASGYALDACDWNPAAERLARSDDEHHGWAVWSIGTREVWHLCESCAVLPKFKRFTRRVWIGPAGSVEAPAGAGGDGEGG